MSTVRVAARVMHSLQSGAAAYVHSLQILLQADKKKKWPKRSLSPHRDERGENCQHRLH